MTLRELDRLFLRASKDIDARQRARIKQLRGLDKALFDELVRRIVEVIGTEDGKVKSGKGSASINRMIDIAFSVVERAQLSEFKRSALGDLSALVKHGQDYFGATDARPMQEVNLRVKRTMRRRLGLDPMTGKPVAGGQFDRFFNNEPMRTEVKQVVSRGITAKIPMAKMLKQLQVTVTGTSQSPGLFSKALQNLVLDTYQQVDRAVSKEYGTRLKLDTFIYAGGLIETSREFCKKRNNQVFTEEEASKWANDPTLPRTKKERDSGVITGYDPLVDMGRFNCRHRTRYISRELAKELRADLGPEQVKPADPEPEPQAPVSVPATEPQTGFVPAKSINEAASRMNALGVQQFEPKGFSIEHANATLKALENIPSRAIPDFIGNGKAFTDFIGRDSIGRSANSWYGVSLGGDMLDKQTFKFKEFQAVGINSRYYKTPEDITARKKFVNDYHKGKTGRDWFFNLDGNLTHFHEHGHIYDNRLGKISDRTEWSQVATRWHYEANTDVLKSHSEAFAEAFADFYGNGGTRLPDYVFKYFKNLEP